MILISHQFIGRLAAAILFHLQYAKKVSSAHSTTFLFFQYPPITVTLNSYKVLHKTTLPAYTESACMPCVPWYRCVPQPWLSVGYHQTVRYR